MWDWNKYTAFDVETSGALPEYALQPHRCATDEAWLTSYAYAHRINSPEMKVGGYAAPVANDPQMLPKLKQWATTAADNNLTVVVWNGVFDIAWLLAYGLEDQVMRLKWLDGMLLWRHLDIEPEYDTDRHKKKAYKLKEAVREFLPKHAGYEEDVDFHDMSPEMVKKRFAYNKRDSTFSLVITRMLYLKLLAENPQGLKAAKIEAECLPLVAKSRVDGMVVNDSVEQLVWELTVQADKALAELAPHGVTEKVVRSPKQLEKLLFDEWKLPSIKLSDAGNRSTDKEVLHELSFIDPRAKTLRTYREALNNRKKFGETIIDSVVYNGDGRTRPGAIVFGTYTGRMTYASKQGKNKDERQTGFALHQMKRGKNFRDSIKAPDGYTICEFDAAGQEFRWMAIASKDETMLSLCMPGEDPHSYMGSRISGEEYRALVEKVHQEDKKAKEIRQLGKVANLSLQYRTSANKLRSLARVDYNIPMELPQAQSIRQTYLETYPGVPDYWREQISTCSFNGYVETFAGRRVQLRDDFNGPNAWRLASTTINYRIQGTGADQKYLALMVLKPYMVKHGIHFAWELHDGLYLYIPDAKVSECVPTIKKLLAKLPYEKAWGFSPPIPLPWDAKVGKTWGGLKEWET